MDLNVIDPFLRKGNFFRACHLQSLAFLQGGDEAGGFQQAVMRASVQPSVSTDDVACKRMRPTMAHFCKKSPLTRAFLGFEYDQNW